MKSKADEIVQELMPPAEPAPVGTAGSAEARPATPDDHVTVDRTALERLAIEIDAMERVAPHALGNPQA